MKLPFGGAQGAVFDFLCPLWFGRLTNQAQCNVAEVKEKKLNAAFRLSLNDRHD